MTGPDREWLKPDTTRRGVALFENVGQCRSLHDDLGGDQVSPIIRDAGIEAGE